MRVFAKGISWAFAKNNFCVFAKNIFWLFAPKNIFQTNLPMLGANTQKKRFDANIFHHLRHRNKSIRQRPAKLSQTSA